MRRRILGLLTVALLLIGAAQAAAAEPPNQNDPCSSNGRDSCGTTGKGFYKTYEFGVRWFGDYRRAIPDVKGGTFCIDLRYWYPSPDYKYKSRSAAGLRNRDGGNIGRKDLARMSYALWNFGRSDKDDQQAAAMLYVHGLMRDGAPGEITPGAAGSGPERIYRKISAEAKRYAGPYKIEIKIPGKVKVGERTKARIRVLSSSGRAVPDAKLRLSGDGVSGLGSAVDTGDDGVTSVGFTPTSTKFKVSGEATNLAAALPKLYVPTTKKASRNGQRLVAPDDGAYRKSVTGRATRTQAKVKTKATPGEVGVGEKSSDVIKISGVPSDWKRTIKVRLYGPYPSRDAIDCAGTPAVSQRSAKRGKNEEPGGRARRTGLLRLSDHRPLDQRGEGADDEMRRSRRDGEGARRAGGLDPGQRRDGSPGTDLTDTVLVSGLVGSERDCRGKPLRAVRHSGRDQVRHQAGLDGHASRPMGMAPTSRIRCSSTRPATTPTARSISGKFVRPGATKCAETTETTIVKGSPKIKTEVYSKRTHPGSKLSDKVKITGLGKLSAPVKVKLWGPYESKGGIDCSAPLRATQTFKAHGDGTYRTKPVKLDRAGYYTYREAIEATDAYSGASTDCAEGPETTITKAEPKIKTVVSNEVVKPGSKIRDLLRVRGLGKTPAKVEVELFGPFSERSKINCSDGNRVTRQALEIKGDGKHLTAPVRVKPVGFYTYREAIKPSKTMSAVKTKCAEVAETSLSRPEIVTGRGDPSHPILAKSTGKNRPQRVLIDRLRIDAPADPSGIARKEGILGVPANIDRTGWWADGGRPGASGATLIAGHVDSARRGAGAFYNLKDARKGDQVKVEVSGGGTRRYRVSSIDQMRKPQLPTDVYSGKGRQRLVLVTCGGPFDTRKGHYRDNIVVTAVPSN